VTSSRLSSADLERLSEEWSLRLEEGLARASFTAEELTELAQRQRALAQVTDSSGQRRALIALAERYELAARERAAVSG